MFTDQEQQKKKGGGGKKSASPMSWHNETQWERSQTPNLCMF